MKKFNGIIIAVVFIYVSLATLLLIADRREDRKESMEYKVEIHEVMRQLEQGAEAAALDLSEYRFLQAVIFLPVENETNIAEFYDGANGVHSCIKPLIIEEMVMGYVRFDFILGTESNAMLWAVEGILLLTFVFVSVLF